MVSQQVIRVPLTDLGVVRVMCKKCKVTTETPLDGLAGTFQRGACPSCGTTFWSRQEQSGPLGDIQIAINELSALSDLLSVEFVLTPPA